jgi:hypothetical protein
MNVQDLVSCSSASHASAALGKNQFVNFLDCLIRKMPGFVALKSIDSMYVSASLLCAQYAGYETIDGLVGKKDNE